MGNKQNRCSCEKSWHFRWSDARSRTCLCQVFGLVEKIKQRPKAVNFWHLVTYRSLFTNTRYYIDLIIIYGSLRPVKGIHCMEGKRFSRPIRILILLQKVNLWLGVLELFLYIIIICICALLFALTWLVSCQRRHIFCVCSIFLQSWFRFNPFLENTGGLGAVSTWQLTILGTALKKRKTSSCYDIFLISIS